MKLSTKTAADTLRNFTDTLLKEIMSNEELVQRIRNEHPEADKASNASADNFETSKNTN